MIGTLRKRMERLKAERDVATENVRKIESEISAEKGIIKDAQQALAILQTVGSQTQQALEYRICELVNLALAAVFDEPYTLRTHFEVKRGQTECRLAFEKNGQEYSPLDASGGGVVDIASFALRLTCLALIKPNPRPLLVLDEPFRFLSADHQPRAAEMLKELSERLGIQVIMVTHNPLLIENADKVFQVKQTNGVSEVVQ